MTTTLAPAPVFRQWDNNGNPLAGGQLFTYAAGTTTPIPSYTDSTGGTPNSNPVILNSRGEANVWLTPNVAYKLQLADSAGNVIWTVDQVINAQLITLYGGVDTGVANAYVLNFAAPFSSLTDGIIIYWIPANTNTTASTLNVNGLGVLPLTNSDGSPIRAGQIVANQIAGVMYKGGNWLTLLNGVANQVLAIPGALGAPSISFQNDPATGFLWTTAGRIDLTGGGVANGYIASGTIVNGGGLTGVSGTVNFNVPYRIMGPIVQMVLPSASGTSSGTSFGAVINAPLVPIVPLTQQLISLPGMTDNGTALFAQIGTVEKTGVFGQNVTFTFYKNGSASGWTGSGTKAIGASGITNYNNVITYSLF